MKKQVITYKEDNEYLMIVYGETETIIRVAIYKENEECDYKNDLDFYLKDGYTIENPDYITDEDLQQVLFDMACLLFTTKYKREQK